MKEKKRKIYKEKKDNIPPFLRRTRFKVYKVRTHLLYLHTASTVIRLNCKHIHELVKHMPALKEPFSVRRDSKGLSFTLSQLIRYLPQTKHDIALTTIRYLAIGKCFAPISISDKIEPLCLSNKPTISSNVSDIYFIPLHIFMIFACISLHSNYYKCNHTKFFLTTQNVKDISSAL